MCGKRVFAVAILFVAACGLLAASASATIMDVVDYSDTFTVGGVRPDGYYNDTALSGTDVKYNIEYARSGLPTVQWKDTGAFSFNSPATAVGGGPGTTGNAGAATGMAQTGADNWSIAYGLRTDYTVQADFNFSVKAGISSWAAVGDRFGATGGLTVFFRKSDAAVGNQVSLYNGVTEHSTGIDTGILASDTSWHNLGARFNQNGGTLSVYVDETLKGTLDLTTFQGGAYATYSNAAVGMGEHPLSWGDNFQVGGAVPEPSTVMLLLTGLIGLLAYAWRKRK